jgi:hypothetical protein
MPRLKVMSEFQSNTEAKGVGMLKNYQIDFCSGFEEDATPRSFFHVTVVEGIN